MAFVTSPGTSQATRAGKTGGVLVEGLDEVVRMFLRGADEIRPQAADVTTKYAEKLADKMRDLVPVVEGDVLESITSDGSATTSGNQVYADAGPDPSANDQSFVSRFLEYGTVKMSPKPFVGPAADQIIPEFEKALRDLVK